MAVGNAGVAFSVACWVGDGMAWNQAVGQIREYYSLWGVEPLEWGKLLWVLVMIDPITAVAWAFSTVGAIIKTLRVFLVGACPKN
jgi:hypothetical protein